MKPRSLEQIAKARWISISEAELYTTMSARSLKDARDAGEITFTLVSGRVLLDRASVDAYLSQNTITASRERRLRVVR